ncbi:methyltransferase domain-containing protein [Vararia minispora EC-137]|uniref:Methyltransferase domain-containing protein n=1 Tax=Vararia minispora EC-137 TaxID=1314806 RepID=A0ACB8Q5Z4_9AGAM|nr:methyltransferase domain-containing protein [Vararia minispora EC-137]
MGLRTRHLLLLLLPLICLTFVLLFTASLDVFPKDNNTRASQTLERAGAWLRQEEESYRNTLWERVEMIKKLGPPRNIESFPLKDKVYTLWDFFTPAFQCPYRVSRIGRRGDGGKWVCGIEEIAKKDKCIVYSFGVSRDSSFEAAVLNLAPGCEVWGYDYNVGMWGPEIYLNKTLSQRAYFFPYGLGPQDHHKKSEAPKMYTLQSIMGLNGHAHIDILKIDIEEDEFEVFRAITDSFDTLPFSQLQLEVHAWNEHGYFPYFLDWWDMLERAGLRPFWFEPNLVHVNLQRGKRPDVAEYSFLNIRGSRGLVPELRF